MLVSVSVLFLVWVVWFGGWCRLRFCSSFWKCLWFLVVLIMFGDVLMIGMLCVLRLSVSFSGVWLLYWMIMLIGFFLLMILSMFLSVSGLKYRWLDVL